MKARLRIALLLLLAAPAVSQQPAGTASVEGVVRRSSDNEPIAGVKVVLTRVVPEGSKTVSSPEFNALSDGTGHFAISNVAAGSYRLSASRNGYMHLEYGQRGSYGKGTEFNLGPGQSLQNVAIGLIPQGSINGHIRSDDGEAVEGVTVQLQRYAYSPDGRRILDTLRSATTNDRGEFRLYWFDPGRYYLLVSGKDNLQNPSFKVGDTAYTPTYYGGVVDAEQAVAIDVRSGDDLAAIDVTLSPQQHRAYRISGTIVDSTTGMPPIFAQVGLTRLLADGAFQGDQRPAYFAPTTGKFSIGDLGPGTYWVSTQVLDHSPAGSTGRTTGETGAIAAVVDVSNRALVRGTQVKVNVTGADVDNLVLTAIPGVSIAGHLTIEGQAIPAAPAGQGIRVDLVGHPAANAPPESPNVNRDGTFVLRSVPIGEYRLKIRGLQAPYYIKEARLGTDDILGQTVSIRGPATATLEVVLSLTPGTISGMVIDELSKAAAGVQVVLIPDRGRERLDLYRTAVTDSHGKFGLEGVAPGDYRIFSWEALEPYSYFDPDIVRDAEPSGKAVHISDSSQESIELRMIPAAR